MERKIIYYKHYFGDFFLSLEVRARDKMAYVLDMLRTQERINKKFVKHICEGIFELRTEYEGNIYRAFFIFDHGNIVVLFNGFQKKSQKTPQREINMAIKLKNEYYVQRQS